MQNLTLVINPGSSSLKFGLFQHLSKNHSIEVCCRGCLELNGLEPIFKIEVEPSFKINHDVIESTKTLIFSSIDQAQTVLAQWLTRFFKPEQIVTVCYRVVHGGDFYDRPVEINPEVLKNIESLIPLAPLHQPFGLKAIKVFKQCFPKALHMACFDTAFHRSMPKVAQFFALPKAVSELGIKPYGFHGLSYHFIKTKLSELIHAEFPARVIVAHLGSGASLCGLLNGQSISTTMSFTPMDGLAMSTRCGAIDAGAVLYMASELKLSFNDIANLLNKQSGLLGLSGISGDIRELISSHSTDAKFAMDFFVYRIWHELGALIGLLQGLDVLVFTGGVGANAWQIREKVCEQFAWMGITLNQTANKSNQLFISDKKSKIKVLAIKTDEELLMAKLVSNSIG